MHAYMKSVKHVCVHTRADINVLCVSLLHKDTCSDISVTLCWRVLRPVVQVSLRQITDVLLWEGPCAVSVTCQVSRHLTQEANVTSHFKVCVTRFKRTESKCTAADGRQAPEPRVRKVTRLFVRAAQCLSAPRACTSTHRHAYGFISKYISIFITFTQGVSQKTPSMGFGVLANFVTTTLLKTLCL